jgi:hypothetical protein
MTIAFPCESCGHRFEVDRSHAGKKCRCKHCGHVFLIPVPRVSAARTSAQPPPRASASRSLNDAADQYGLYEPLPPLPQAPPTAEAAPKAARPKKKRKRYDGEPWAYPLRVASVVFMAVGVFGAIVSGLIVAYYVHDVDVREVLAGRIPAPPSVLIVLGLINIVAGVSLVIGVILTFFSFVGTILNFSLGNRRAFGSEDILVDICWYGSAAVTGLIVAALVLPYFNHRRLGRDRLLARRPDQVGILREPARPQVQERPTPPPVLPTALPPAAPRTPTAEPARRPEPPRFNRPDVPGPPPALARGPFRAGAANERLRSNGPEGGFDGSLDSAIAALRNGDGFRRNEAIDGLSRMAPDPARRSEVARALENVMSDGEAFVRPNAAKALAVWGTSENTPALIEALKEKNVFVRGAALDAVLAINDPSAAEAVAALLPQLGDRGKASRALKAMGPPAQAAVVKYLNHPDVFTRAEACHLLQVIGRDDASRAALRDLVRRTGGFGLDANAAKEALRSLGDRG